MRMYFFYKCKILLSFLNRVCAKFFKLGVTHMLDSVIKMITFLDST